MILGEDSMSEDLISIDLCDDEEVKENKQKSPPKLDQPIVDKSSGDFPVLPNIKAPRKWIKS